MSKVNSTARARARKPKKPHKDFPLFAHASGRWCKKIRGKFHYFGPWSDPQAALERWIAEKDDLLAGHIPKSRRLKDEWTLRDLVNQFLTTKNSLVEQGELSPHSFIDYHRVCESLTITFGKETFLADIQPGDFDRLKSVWAKKWGPVRIGNEINRTRVIFNYAYKNGLIPAPMRYGEGFKRPSAKVLELARHEKGERMFEADELRGIINAARQPLKAMFLLGINAGMGNSDVARMKLKHLDLKGGWIDYPRGKTGVNRRCWLWGETVKAIKESLALRPLPKNEADADLVFLTAPGGSWYRDTSDNPVSREVRILLDSLGIKGNKNFYALRHTFQTIGEESLDQVAVRAVMGHKDAGMAGKYRERISDERLIAVAEHVRTWLFPPKKEKRKGR